MIPLKLTVRNFLSYREDVPTLNFAGIRVACLCGSNGHGKSALLDAITWALWGTARGKTLDDLISYGADECRVELDFSARGQDYRVVRRRRRARSSDLQLLSLDGAEARPISGNTAGDTQAQINRTVGMDYATFVNSAFLVQGRAGEFTNKTPGERKQLLGKILGLETYDRLQAAAKEQGEQARARAEAVRGSLERMREELATLKDPAVELAAAESELGRLSTELEGRRRETLAIREQVATLRGLMERAQDSRRQLEARRQELADLRAAAESGRQRAQEYAALIGEADSIRQGAADLAAAKDKFEELERVRVRVDLLDRERREVMRGIDVARARVEAELTSLKSRAETSLLPAIQQKAALEAELAAIRSDGSLLARQGREISEAREAVLGLTGEIAQLENLIAGCVEEGKELRNKLALLNGAGGRDAVCPLCLTPLSDDGCLRLTGVYEQEIGNKLREHKQASSRLGELRARKDELATGLPAMEDALARSQEKRQLRIRDLEAGIEYAAAAQIELDESALRVQQMKQSLVNGHFAKEESDRGRELEDELNALAYSDEERRDCYTQIQSLSDFPLRLESLRRAEDGLPEVLEAVCRAEESADRHSQDIASLTEELADADQALGALPALRSNLALAEEEETALARRVAEAASRRGYLQSECERERRLKTAVQSQAAELKVLEDQQSVYQQLQGALGRRGVQAMLIETVLPRLEDYTNELLGRMTDNRMHVRLESLREPPSGRREPRETLEVHVSDELGPRPYEMYSGGEAFRVNLALRIALSKVLAQRTGAPLPTLFIDEGFGTQDTVGRERILDVISAIGDEFEMVIVITHLDDLKEAFPVRIEVQKNASGSTFWLS